MVRLPPARRSIRAVLGSFVEDGATNFEVDDFVLGVAITAAAEDAIVASEPTTFDSMDGLDASSGVCTRDSFTFVG